MISPRRDARVIAARKAIALALPLLQEQRAVVVECHSDMRLGRNGQFYPVRGTLDERAVEHVAAFDAAIRACRHAKRTLAR